MIVINDSIIGILINILIMVVNVVFECKLNNEIVIVIVNLKKLEVLIKYVGLVMLCLSLSFNVMK